MNDTEHRPGWMPLLRQPRWMPGGIVVGCLLIAGYVGCVWLGSALVDPVTHIIPVYPAAGFVLAVMLRCSWRRSWLWATLTVFTGAYVEGGLIRYYPVAITNLAAILLTAYLIERFADGARFLERPETVFRFVLLCTLALGLVSASLGVGFLIWVGDIPPHGFVRQTAGWAIGDVTGALLVVPVMLAWSDFPNWLRQTLACRLETAALLVTSVVITQVSFGGWPFRYFYALEYLTIPVLLWAAFRFPHRAGATTTLLVAALAVANTLLRRGPFAVHPHDALILLQAYLGSVSLLVLVIAAGVRQHQSQALALRQAFAEAEAARGEAERADRGKSAFLSRMSHELRTPLNAILGFGQILQLQGEQDETVAECSGHILDAGRHLLSLVNEVLDLATLNRGRMVLSPEPVEMALLVRECIGQLGEQAREHQVSCRLDAPGDDPPGERKNLGGRTSTNAHAEDCCVVLADRARLRQVICHLLSNAIQYNVEGGRVDVSFVRVVAGTVEGRTGKWRIRVADTGRGISAENQEQLFSLFQRLGAERTDRKGSGVGLAISKSLIEAMSGRLGLESTPGNGSVFWVELPATEHRRIEPAPFALEEAWRSADEGINELAGEAARLAAASEQNRTVLYVEDNASNLHLVRSSFERYFPDLRLLSAANGREGLRLAQQHQPGLILLDVQLPDIDGDVVLTRLRSNAITRDIPVVILSADATPASRQRLLGAGAREYLTKPLEIPVFLALINRVFQAGVKIPQEAR